MKWWLSFADANGFMGVAIVEAETLREAMREAWWHKCNPGGEVMGQPLDPEDPGWALPMNTLLTEDESREAGGHREEECRERGCCQFSGDPPEPVEGGD